MREHLKHVAPLIVAYGLLALLGVLALRNYSVAWVSGGSMLPALVQGDVVVVAKSAPLRRGDIALLRPGATLVLHRVVHADPNGRVWTRGDANPVADLNPTAATHVRGRVVRVIPFGGLLHRWRGGGRCDTLPAQPHSARL
ncbi:MAG: signal peptidase I [Actinobacteria bacterium HGW-Actinobacteria-7]|jgi:signal peptidase I|nr:MAG: signal peptidase I [Actinobacteria bacterium HGW-Actinobacteria-7]